MVIFKITLDENHPDIADTYNSLANLYSEQAKHEEAEEYCKKALEIRQNPLNKKHPDIKETKKISKKPE